MDVLVKLWGSKKWCKSGAKSLIIGTRYMQWGSEQANSVLSPLNQLAMLPLYVKSEEWKKIPLLGYGVHISNKVGDFTTTMPCSLLSLQYVQLLEVGADFLFHPEGFSYHCYQNCLHVWFFNVLTVSIWKMFPSICCAKKGSCATPAIFLLTNLLSICWCCTTFTPIQWNKIHFCGYGLKHFFPSPTDNWVCYFYEWI